MSCIKKRNEGTIVGFGISDKIAIFQKSALARREEFFLRRFVAPLPAHPPFSLIKKRAPTKIFYVLSGRTCLITNTTVLYEARTAPMKTAMTATTAFYVLTCVRAATTTMTTTTIILQQQRRRLLLLLRLRLRLRLLLRLTITTTTTTTTNYYYYYKYYYYYDYELLRLLIVLLLLRRLRITTTTTTTANDYY